MKAVMSGQMYARVGGPELLCEVITLDGDWAYCWMTGAGRDYSRRLVECDWLRSADFRLVHDPWPDCVGCQVAT